jgi:lambda family phage portal protein
MQMLFQFGQTARVPAEAVCHVYRPRRPGQQRGETEYAAVMLALYELEKYDRAELVRKAVTAMFAFFERDLEGGMAPMSGQTETDDKGTPIQGVEPGSYVRLPAGKTIEFAEPKDVGGMYVEFLRVQLRKVAAGLGITYEMLTGDLTGVNYSSIRAGLLEFRRRAEAFQHQVMVFRFCRPVWKAWCDAAALAGVIDAADYAANQSLYLAVEWKPPAWAWVDPLKDIHAEVMAMDNLIKSRSDVINERGGVPEEVDRTIASDQQREKDLGLERRARNGQMITDSQAPGGANGTA